MKGSIIGGILTTILAGLFVASVAMASAGSLGYFQPSASGKQAVDSNSTAKGDKPAADEGATSPQDGGATVSREAECRGAAGLPTVGDGEAGSGSTVAGGTAGMTKKGLEHAIEVVLANCIKNPKARGLVNALRNLAENRDRHAAHEAAKAVRRTAQETEKAARRTAAGQAKGNGKTSG